MSLAIWLRAIRNRWRAHRLRLEARRRIAESRRRRALTAAIGPLSSRWIEVNHYARGKRRED
jgi:hypothetical protein